MRKRRVITLERHIIDDVYKDLDGRYTRNQIRDLFDASICYILHLMRFTTTIAVTIPKVGYMCVNRRDMEKFVKRTKQHNRTNAGIIELRAARRRLKDTEDMEPIRGMAFSCNTATKDAYRKRLGNYSDIEKKQNTDYNNYKK